MSLFYYICRDQLTAHSLYLAKAYGWLEIGSYSVPLSNITSLCLLHALDVLFSSKKLNKNK